MESRSILHLDSQLHFTPQSYNCAVEIGGFRLIIQTDTGLLTNRGYDFGNLAGAFPIR